MYQEKRCRIDVPQKLKNPPAPTRCPVRLLVGTGGDNYKKKEEREEGRKGKERGRKRRKKRRERKGKREEEEKVDKVVYIVT